MSVWGRANLAREEWYEFLATGEVLKPLVDARNAERYPNVRSFQRTP